MCLFVGNIIELLCLVRYFLYGFENFIILRKKINKNLIVF